MAKEEKCSESSNRVFGGRVWKTSWKLKVPNKIKVFGWRACHNILPTRANLAQKRIIQGNFVKFAKIVLNLEFMHYGLVEWHRMFGLGALYAYENALGSS